MISVKQVWRWWVAGLALVLVLAACGGASSEEASPTEVEEPGATEDASVPDETSDTPETTDSADARAPDVSAMSSDEVSELLFGSFDIEDQAANEARFAEEERVRQEAVAQCMTAQGFEYSPVDYSQFDGFGPGSDLDPSSREYAETYGLGFSTFFEEQGFGGPGGVFVDPNQEYVEALSDSARDAYYAALYGEQPEFDPSFSDDDFEAQLEENPELFQPQGCEGEAFSESSSFGNLDRVYRELGDQLEEVFSRAESDPRIVAARADWAVCMADAGYTFSTTDEMYQDLDDRMQGVYSSQTFPGEDLSEDEFNALTDEERDELFSQESSYDEALLAEVNEYEIALALANFDCGGADYQAFSDVYAEYQQTFIEENLAAIQQILAEE